MTQDVIEVPLFPLLLAGLVVACFLVAKLPMSRFTGKPPPLEALQERLGLGMRGLNSGLFLLILVFWGVLFLALFLGLLSLLYDILAAGVPQGNADWTDWRFSLTKVAALTAVLGAVVALPFTLIRINLNHQQVETDRDALFNEKINVAVTDLHAQRQVTRWTAGKAENGWEDDITRRNGAIDRLEGLVGEDSSLSPRVSRMLSVYVLELSRNDAQAEPVGDRKGA